MQIKPLVGGILNEPVQANKLHPKGAKFALGSKITTRDLGDFILTLPDPVTLSLNNARNFIDKALKIKDRISRSKDYIIYLPGVIGSINARGAIYDDIIKNNPNASVIRSLDEAEVLKYVQACMGIVIFLITALESFLNMTIPEDYVTQKTGRKGDIITCDKQRIMERFSIEEKIDILIELKNVQGLKQGPHWHAFKSIKLLRDDIIHFKNVNKQVESIWNPMIEKFVDTDLESFFQHTIMLIQVLEPSRADM